MHKRTSVSVLGWFVTITALTATTTSAHAVPSAPVSLSTGLLRVRRGLAADIVARHLGESSGSYAYVAEEGLTSITAITADGLVRRQSGTSGLTDDKQAYAKFVWTEALMGSVMQHVLVDTGSSDTWLTSPFPSTGMANVNAAPASIDYAWGIVQNVVQKSLPAGTLSIGNRQPNIQNLAYFGWVNDRTTTPLDSFANNLAGVVGLGPTSIAKLSKSTQWQSWCPSNNSVFYLNLPQAQFRLCEVMPSTLPVKLNLPFDTRSQRGVVTLSSLSFVAPASTASVPAGNGLSVLFDSGSPYIIIPYNAAKSFAQAVVASSLKRRDADFPELSETGSESVERLYRRGNRTCPCDGGWPSQLTVQVTRFVVPCTWTTGGRSPTISIKLNNVIFSLPPSTYTYQDTDYGRQCFSAIVGYNVTSFKNELAESTLTDFSIFGVPFFQASAVQWDFTNKNVKIAQKP